jgi:O-antigen/teichoic acid export membrane protein
LADDIVIPEPGPRDLARRVAAGAGWAQVSRIAEVITSLALSLILVRALGPDSFGQYSFLVNAATFAAIALSLGFPDTVMRFVSSLLAEGSIDKVSFLVRRLVVVRLLLYGGAVVALGLFHGPLASALHLPLVDRYWTAIAALLVSQGAIEFTTSYAYARLRSRDVAIARTLGQVVALAFFVAIVAMGLSSPVSASLTVVISYLTATVILLFRGLGQVLLSGPGTKAVMAPIAGFAVAAWGASLFNLGLAGQIDVILLGALRRDPAQIAYYAVATLIFVKLGLLLSGWAGTAISSFAELQARRGPEGVRRFFTLYIRVHLLLALIVYPPLILLAGVITQRVFGPGYAAAAQLMAIYGGFWLISSFLAAGIPLSSMLALGSQRQALGIRATTGALNVVLDVLLIPPLGALGAIIATGTANVIAHFSDYVVAARRIKAGYPLTFALRLGVAAGVASLPGLILHPGDVIGALFVAALYVGLFAAGLFLLKPLSAEDAALAARFSRRAGIVVGQLVGNRSAN